MVSKILANKMPSLDYLIKNDLFIICPLLSTADFISYCVNRGFQVTRRQLEQLEKLEIFYPIARARFPKIKKKIEYVDNGKRYKVLGRLEDGEEWPGDVEERYVHFYFARGDAKDWFEEGLLWDTSTQPFQHWETFKDENNYRCIESFYSIFQCYPLYNFIREARVEFGAEWWVSYSKGDIEKRIKEVSEWANTVISGIKENGIKGEATALLCQIISNRYFPKTQTDQRFFQLSDPYYYNGEWHWDKYCLAWDAEAVMAETRMNIEEIERLHRLVTFDAKSVDPLDHWYELVSFTAVEQKKKLKGKALLAQTLYSMEHMLRLFYEDLTGKKLYPPDEKPNWTKDKYYGEDVTQDVLRHLEFVTNRYRLNPKPKLILIVEGNGEAEQFPRIAKEVFGCSFSKLGIDIINIQGVGNFTGRKGAGAHSPFARFIDDYHNRQTIVFVVLDNEGGVSKVKNDVIKASSMYYEKRTITKNEYIHLWDTNIEFDNFSHQEIAQAMTELCENRYIFQPDEIEQCKASIDAKKGDPLSKLFKERSQENLSKPKLLGKLFDKIISNKEKEFDDDDKPIRPVLQVIQKVIELALLNHQPTRYDSWEKNQESGYLGDLTKPKNE